MAKIFIIFSYVIFSILIITLNAVDFITVNQTLRDDGNSNIISAGAIFELGFFSLGSSKNRYVGIWYKNISNRTVVWVANRDTPITDSSGVLKFAPDGNLVLLDGNNNNKSVWSTSLSSSVFVTNRVAQLLDDGNFVIRNGNDSDLVHKFWQSFDHPGDNMLPGMIFGWNSKGLNTNLTSWRSSDDPSPGNYTLVMDLRGYPTIVIMFNSMMLQYRFGAWNGVQFSGLNVANPDPSFSATGIINSQQIDFSFDVSNSSVIMRGELSSNGKFQILKWVDETQIWAVYVGTETDVCDEYARCGEYGVCNGTRCECMTGFEPKNKVKWDLGNGTDGCVRRTKLCENEDGFIKYSGLKLPGTDNSWFDLTMTLSDCEKKCLSNCSCTAYANADIRLGGTGCLLWFDDLIDMRDYSGGLDLYVKLAASDFPVARTSSKGSNKRRMIIIVVLLVALLLGLILVALFRKKMQRKEENGATKVNNDEDMDLPLFDLKTIVVATNDFSLDNKLGQGGFGPVYKGVLTEGQEIAVKRLSKQSRQGLDEFKNEVSVIAKLQHRNLVRLLGCCIEEGEMMLVYEYMPNKSLDSLPFDDEQSKFLDWSTRYNIISGIARGLLYLHQDSRLRIIHRDLKAGNILLDNEMNPRISDFGLARSFGGNETEASTTRVVGTFGYMSPEYAFDGVFSFKSDVYSFGVLLLEIISGIKMRMFYNSDPSNNLLNHAWRLYTEGKVLDLINKDYVESYDEAQVYRILQIGLLCVQPHPQDRPNMAAVVLMLSSEIEVQQPKEPTLFPEKLSEDFDSSSRETFGSLSTTGGANRSSACNALAIDNSQ